MRYGASAVPEPCSATTGIGDLELGDAAGRERVRVRLVRDDVDDAQAVDEDGLRVDAGRGRQIVAAVPDDAGHAGPVVVDGDQAGVRPVLGERQRLRRRCRRRPAAPGSIDSRKVAMRAATAIGGRRDGCHGGEPPRSSATSVRTTVTTPSHTGLHTTASRRGVGWSTPRPAVTGARCWVSSSSAVGDRSG